MREVFTHGLRLTIGLLETVVTPVTGGGACVVTAMACSNKLFHCCIGIPSMQVESFVPLLAVSNKKSGNAGDL